jgi:hypothetical protein
MSTYLHPKYEKRALDEDRSPQKKSNFAKEFKHTKAGVWDVYEQIPHNKFGFNIPWISKLTRNLEIFNDLPFIWRVIKDVMNIKSCRYYLSLFILVKILLSLQPAVALWCVVLRVIYTCDPTNAHRSGSLVNISPLFVFFF